MSLPPLHASATSLRDQKTNSSAIAAAAAATVLVQLQHGLHHRHTVMFMIDCATAGSTTRFDAAATVTVRRTASKQ
jgi:hypothetical protein